MATIYLGDGDDGYVSTTGEDDLIFGEEGNDLIFGGDGVDNLFGGNGDDNLNGGVAEDALWGGSGSDTAFYGFSLSAIKASLDDGYGYMKNAGLADKDIYVSIENITGSSLSDSLEGNGGGNRLRGNNGNDTMSGLAGNDDLLGGNGDDYLIGGHGGDDLEGGGGNDIASYEGASSGVSLSLLTGVGYAGYANGDTFSSIERVHGSGFGDTLIGGNESDVFDGKDGNDVILGQDEDDYIYGWNGNDTINGGDGDDRMWGAAGADQMNGGDGIDSVSYFFANAGVTVNMLTGATSGDEAAGDVLSNIEHLSGGSYNDTLIGNAQANAISGTSGNDSVNGAGGDDTVTGGHGKDTLAGGNGTDIFSYYSASNSTVALTGRDTILDFSQAQNDRIDLSDIDAKSSSGSDDAFTFIGTDTFSGTPGQLRWGFVNGGTVIAGDVNGDLTADFRISLEDAVTLDAGDFIL